MDIINLSPRLDNKNSPKHYSQTKKVNKTSQNTNDIDQDILESHDQNAFINDFTNSDVEISKDIYSDKCCVFVAILLSRKINDLICEKGVHDAKKFIKTNSRYFQHHYIKQKDKKNLESMLKCWFSYCKKFKVLPAPIGGPNLKNFAGVPLSVLHHIEKCFKVSITCFSKNQTIIQKIAKCDILKSNQRPPATVIRRGIIITAHSSKMGVQKVTQTTEDRLFPKPIPSEIGYGLKNSTFKNHDWLSCLFNIDLPKNVKLNTIDEATSKSDDLFLHVNLIMRPELYSKNYICKCCHKVYSRYSILNDHEKNCTNSVKTSFTPGVFTVKRNILDQIAAYGIKLPTLDPKFVCYDFEAIMFNPNVHSDSSLSDNNSDDNSSNKYTSKVTASDRRFPIQPGVLPENVKARAKCVAQGKNLDPRYFKKQVLDNEIPDHHEGFTIHRPVSFAVSTDIEGSAPILKYYATDCAVTSVMPGESDTKLIPSELIRPIHTCFVTRTTENNKYAKFSPKSSFELIKIFSHLMTALSKQAYRINKRRYKTVLEELLSRAKNEQSILNARAKQHQKNPQKSHFWVLRNQLKTYLRQLVCLGFNSSNYDLRISKIYLFRALNLRKKRDQKIISGLKKPITNGGRATLRLGGPPLNTPFSPPHPPLWSLWWGRVCLVIFHRGVL